MANSNQDIETPDVFVRAVEAYLGIAFAYDIACTEGNKKAPIGFTQEQDSLRRDWPTDGWIWNNPPFKNLTSWVRKCKQQMDRSCRIVSIWPLSGDQNQILTWTNAKVYVVHGRIWPEVRGCMLCLWQADKTVNSVGLRWDKKTLTQIW
jgi:hypothetical protein